jgi:hypothetical protein
MECFCCGAEIDTARKVKVRHFLGYDPRNGGPDSAAYKSYKEEVTYRWSVICHLCYSTLDNLTGLAEIAGRNFTLAAASRGGKATTVDEAKYRAFRRKEAAKLGIDLDDKAQ